MWARSILIMALPLAIASCQTTSVERQTAALTLSADNLGQRQIDSRRFDTEDEAEILAACAGVLQDLGFSIEEGSSESGFVVGSKDRDAVETGQVAGQMVLATLAAALGARVDPVWDRDQKIRIAIVTKPTPRSPTLVRATFQRVGRNNKGQISRME